MLEPATGAMTAAARWRRTVAALLLLAAGAAGAQTFDLAPDGFSSVRESARADDGGLWLNVIDRKDGAKRGSSLIKLSPALVMEREVALPALGPPGLAAFAGGVLTVLEDTESSRAAVRDASERPSRLVWIPDAPEPELRTLFRWTSRDYPTLRGYAAAALDGSGVYLVQGEREKPAVVKLSRDGGVLWRRDLLAAEVADVVAAPEGLIAVHRVASRRGAHAVALLSLSGNGDRLWDAEVPISVSPRAVELVPPRTLAFVSWQSGEALAQLDLVDVIDGTKRTVTMPGALPRVSPVAGGMLYASHAAGQPLIAFVDDTGAVRWTRRLQLLGTDRSSRLGPDKWLDVQPLGVNGIAVIASWQDPEAGVLARVVAADSAGLALASDYGACLAGDALRIATLERTLLRAYGIGVELGAHAVERRPVDANGCALPSDADYLRFLEELADELVLVNADKVEQYSKQIVVTVDSFDEPYGLLRYVFMSAGFTEISYGATADAARPLARGIAERARPNLARMRDAWIAFRETTGCSLSVSKPGERGLIDDASFYAAIEQAAETVIGAARRVMTDPDSGLERSAERCVLVLTDERAGTYRGGFRPYGEIDGVLREILAGPT